MTDAEEFVLVLSTAGTEAQAVQIARGLVERKLAACVNVVGQACSIYRWQGEILEEEERLLLIKTSASLFEQVAAAIRELHTYEVPEVVMLPVDATSEDYGRWLSGCLQGAHTD